MSESELKLYNYISKNKLGSLLEYGLYLYENNNKLFINWCSNTGKTNLLCVVAILECLKKERTKILLIINEYSLINSYEEKIYNILLKSNINNIVNDRTISSISFSNDSKIFITTQGNTIINNVYDYILYDSDMYLKLLHNIVKYNEKFIIATNKIKFDNILNIEIKNNKNKIKVSVINNSVNIKILYRILKMEKLKKLINEKINMN
jgi:hypothetical protein